MGILNGKVALITGAAQGVGETIARAFVAEGASVHLADINSEAGVALASELGQRAIYHHLDVSQDSDWLDVMEKTLAKDGLLDILVNNAGITGYEAGVAIDASVEADLEDWRKVRMTNLYGVFLGCKHAIRAMRASGKGSIINISPRSSLAGTPATVFASSKVAVRNYTKTVALYCAAEGLAIRCNSIHPAAILSPIGEPMLGDSPDGGARMAARGRDTPLKEFGRLDEVAAVAIMLGSDGVAYITGAEFHLGGAFPPETTASPEHP